jgi:hypothetical protein
MPRGKSTKIKPFEKLLFVLSSGSVVTIEDINEILGEEIYMYRVSSYIWAIKVYANGVIKVIKDGRNVVAYQLLNTKEAKTYLSKRGFLNFIPGQTKRKPSNCKLAQEMVYE